MNACTRRNLRVAVGDRLVEERRSLVRVPTPARPHVGAHAPSSRSPLPAPHLFYRVSIRGSARKYRYDVLQPFPYQIRYMMLSEGKYITSFNRCEATSVRIVQVEDEHDLTSEQQLAYIQRSVTGRVGTSL